MNQMEEAYKKWTTTITTKTGCTIKCKKGLWSVDAPTERKADVEARHYFTQYYADGEYMETPDYAGLDILLDDVAGEWKLGGIDASTIYGEYAMEVARRAVLIEREACAKIADARAMRCEEKASMAEDTDDANELRSLAWQFSVLADEMRKRSNTTNQTPCQPAPPLLVGLERN